MNIDLRTEYLGLALRNPLVVAACPLTGWLETLKRLRDAGAAAVVLPSLFEEQITHEESQVQALQEFHAESYAESLTYFPELEDYNTGPRYYLNLIADAKRTLDIPVIASLNGTTKGGWLEFASKIQAAGADALELNIYHIPTDIDATSLEVEKRYLDIVAAVRSRVKIPIAVKTGPYFSSFANMAKRTAGAGANGLVLFNRFLQPDIDLETRAVAPSMVLSHPEELRMPLRWIAILKGRVDISLAANSGIYEATDVIKAIMVGADVAQCAATVIRHGPDHLRAMLNSLKTWMAEHEYGSVAQLKGCLSQLNCPDPESFERANYMKVLASFTSVYR
ncbi:MAG: dihydroorotate dehydrogenase-like protein [Planctomycetota bacterium]